jgi:hypothetical protein
MIPQHIFEAVYHLRHRLPSAVLKVTIERAADGYAVTLQLATETVYYSLDYQGVVQLAAVEQEV